jgi:hypothetical protein
VAEGAEVTLVFASALGIKLPLLGLHRDDARLTLSTNASFGPVQPQTPWGSQTCASLNSRLESNQEDEEEAEVKP